MSGIGIVIAVEGQSERIFVERYLTHFLIPHRGYSLSVQRLRGDGLQQLQIRSNTQKPDFNVLLIECEGDERVLSFVLERIEGWIAKGYLSITGLRDVFPAAKDKLSTIEGKTHELLAQYAVDATILFAVMELEAWFLAEYRHLSAVHAGLTPAYILETTGIDLLSCDFESNRHPSVTLREILATVNLDYTKKEAEVYRSVGRLDLERIYLETRESVPRLGVFLDRLDTVFA